MEVWGAMNTKLKDLSSVMQASDVPKFHLIGILIP